MDKFPVGFMSYARSDDEHDNGRLTEFCKRLSGEVRMQTGEQFDIFQDRYDISWGQQWKRRIGDGLDASTFLIPIITPSFFKSDPCRDELERFLARESELGRNDLILPLYYVGCTILDDECKRNADRLARLIGERHYFDWRDLRFEPFGARQSRKTLAGLATQIAGALDSRVPQQRITCTSVAMPGGANGSGSMQAAPHAAEPTPDRGSYATLKPAIRTLIVDACHPGNFTTVSDALDAAEAGDRILVRPGLYLEGIVIDKPVEIIGEGELGEVIIEAIGEATVVFQANRGRIANLLLRQMGGGKWHCLDIAQGRLDVEGCDISGCSLACVAVHDGADPSILRNRIHHGGHNGVYVYGNGRGSFEENEIFGNTHSGVLVKTGGNPVFRHNRIHDNRQCGVIVTDKALGVFEENHIFKNPYGGVQIKNESNPFFRRNRIYGAEQSGVYVFQDGRGTLEDNQIFGNAVVGVHTSSGGNPICRRNVIFRSANEAIWIDLGGKGSFEENDLRENLNAAWDSSSDCIADVIRKQNQE
jgi:parallel beta-helix repeat protein